MEGSQPERRRVLSLEDATHTFLMQIDIFPYLLDEVMDLSGGAIGVLKAVIETVAEEISYTPLEATTRERIRSIVGAPADPDEMDAWRSSFWREYKEQHNLV